jgi:hypothetical protein
MALNATFNNISVYRGSQFYWWRKPEYPEKTTDLMQVTDKLYHVKGQSHNVKGCPNVWNFLSI